MKFYDAATTVVLGDVVQWGIHIGPVTRIAHDGKEFFLEFEHSARVVSEGGVVRHVRTWVRESDVTCVVRGEQ